MKTVSTGIQITPEVLKSSFLLYYPCRCLVVVRNPLGSKKRADQALYSGKIDLDATLIVVNHDS